MNRRDSGARVESAQDEERFEHDREVVPERHPTALPPSEPAKNMRHAHR